MIKGARTVARRFQGALEQEEALIADAEGDRLRMQAATARLLERADNLERRAEGEEMQVSKKVQREMGDTDKIVFSVCTDKVFIYRMVRGRVL